MALSRRGRIAARVVFYGAVVFLLIPAALSQSLVKALRQPTTAAPRDFEGVDFTSEGLKLRGWLLPGPAEGTKPAAVVAHGVGDGLESFVETARTLRRRGHTVLLFDFRGHGGSEGSVTSLGGREREDVRAAMAVLRQRGLARNGFLLVGHSMGAVAVLRAAAVEPDVRGVVAEAPFDTYRETVAHHGELFMHVPRWVPLLHITIAIAEWRVGFSADEVDAVRAAREMKAPLLLIADGADLRMPERVVRKVYDAHRGPRDLWVAPGVEHVGASLLPDYWPRVTAFLDAHGL